MTVQWNKLPWPQPAKASVVAILESYGVLVRDGQFSVTPETLIPNLSEEDNQVLSAFGVFGSPATPVEGADYSLFSGVVTTNTEKGFSTVVYRDGEVIATRDTVSPPDTVALWNEVTA